VVGKDRRKEGRKKGREEKEDATWKTRRESRRMGVITRFNHFPPRVFSRRTLHISDLHEYGQHFFTSPQLFPLPSDC
jgi:hypothetical protein